MFQSKWLGGFKDKDGQPVTGKMTMKRVLGSAFDLVDEVDMHSKYPYLSNFKRVISLSPSGFNSFSLDNYG
jgi:hypothetical protein